MKIQFLDKDGWPVTLTRGRIIRNVLRLILHTKKIRFGEFVQNAKESGSTMNTAGAVTQGAEMDKKTTVRVLPGSRRCRIANGADIFHDNARKVYHEPPGSPPRVFMGIECVLLNAEGHFVRVTADDFGVALVDVRDVIFEEDVDSGAN